LVPRKGTLWLSEKRYTGSEPLVPGFMKSWQIPFVISILSQAMETRIWLKDCGTYYEYICTYVDDLMCSMKDPQAFLDDLTKDPYNYKLTGVRDPHYHLGGDFSRADCRALTWGYRKYSKKMLANYERIFHELPRKMSSPMERESLT
jgi:hypothetical protein